MSIKALLLDMDGTVTDTEKIYNRNWMKAAEMLNMDFTFQDSLDLRSLNRNDCVKMFRERHGESFDYDRLHSLVTELVAQEQEKNGVPVKPGLNELITACRQKNVKAVIVTATNLNTAVKRLQTAGVYEMFDKVISAHEAKRGKPHPEPYLLALDRLGLQAGDCMAVEDSPNGVKSAVAAGIRTIMVPDLTEPDDELSQIIYARADSLADVSAYF